MIQVCILNRQLPTPDFRIRKTASKQGVQPDKHWFWAQNGFGNKLHGVIALTYWVRFVFGGEVSGEGPTISELQWFMCWQGGKDRRFLWKAWNSSSSKTVRARKSWLVWLESWGKMLKDKAVPHRRWLFSNESYSAQFISKNIEFLSYFGLEMMCSTQGCL